MKSLLLIGALSAAALSPLAAQQQPAPTNQDIEAIKRQMQALIASQLAVQKQLDEITAMLKAGAQAPAPAPAPAIANVDFVIDIATSAVKGAPTARVAIIEFSDYECPFCARHALTTLPELAKEYIDTGKIRYVFRNLPLESIHPNAMRAAVAAECAGEHGKYWLTPGDSKARAVRLIRGAHPYPTFKAAIDSVLATIK